MKAFRVLCLLVIALSFSVPVLAQGLDGIYALCPRKNPARCQEAADEFRRHFPDDQTGPYIFIRPEGTGYLAPDTRRTQDFNWSPGEDNLLIMKMSGRDGRTLKFQVNGSILRNAATGELYHLSIPYQEWNTPPKKRPGVKR